MAVKRLEISAIIPTYNRRNLLKRALTSVLNQTRPPQQIIVIDDGSEDDTAKLVQHEFPDIEYIYQRNAGVSAARNRGIQAARYPWIAFLDSDDEWLPDKLEEQQAALAMNPFCCICHTDEIWIRKGRRVNPKDKHRKYGGYIFERCLPLCVISPSAVLIHRELFEQYGQFDEKMPAGEDYDMWLRICAIEQVLYVEKKLVIKYGGHADQLSHRYWGMDRFRIYSLEKIISSGLINTFQHYAALSELENKLKVYITGARKRKKISDVKIFSEKLKRIRTQLKNFNPQVLTH